jgi:hypothetical protein
MNTRRRALLFNIIIIVALASFSAMLYDLRSSVGPKAFNANSLVGLPTSGPISNAVTQEQDQLQRQKQQQLLQDQQGEENFIAHLSGNNEVPPINTDATGIVNLALNSEEGAKILGYGLTITNLNGGMGAHIHLGEPGQNGPIVADMRPPNMSVPSSSYPSSKVGNSATIPSNTVSGTITPADLKGPLADKQLSVLLDLMKKGKTYVNIPTKQHQNGELRGQILPS